MMLGIKESLVYGTYPFYYLKSCWHWIELRQGLKDDNSVSNWKVASSSIFKSKDQKRNNDWKYLEMNLELVFFNRPKCVFTVDVLNIWLHLWHQIYTTMYSSVGKKLHTNQPPNGLVFVQLNNLEAVSRKSRVKWYQIWVFVGEKANKCTQFW